MLPTHISITSRKPQADTKSLFQGTWQYLPGGRRCCTCFSTCKSAAVWCPKLPYARIANPEDWQNQCQMTWRLVENDFEYPSLRYPKQLHKFHSVLDSHLWWKKTCRPAWKQPTTQKLCVDGSSESLFFYTLPPPQQTKRVLHRLVVVSSVPKRFKALSKRSLIWGCNLASNGTKSWDFHEKTGEWIHLTKSGSWEMPTKYLQLLLLLLLVVSTHLKNMIVKIGIFPK